MCGEPPVGCLQQEVEKVDEACFDHQPGPRCRDCREPRPGATTGTGSRAVFRRQPAGPAGQPRRGWRLCAVAPARGVNQAIQENNAFVALINHDGSVHTARWIGVQNPPQRAVLQPPLVLNEPFGSDIEGGILYMADRDGGTADPADPSKTTPSVAVIRKFDMKTGAPVGEVRIEGSPWINDIEVAPDGTIYASNSGVGGKTPEPDTWQIWRVTPDGTASVWIEGEPLNQPNGIAFDTEGNVVVVNIGNDEVLTFAAADAKLLKTEKAAQPGNDGIVVLPDGTKYISSVMNGGITRLTPDGTATLIAENIPSAASMCYDAGADQLVVPMNANNGLAFISLK